MTWRRKIDLEMLPSKLVQRLVRLMAKAHKAALEAAQVARQEFNDLTKQIEALKKQLEKSTKRLKSALKYR
jgi:signal transduction histidine kinase